MVSERTDFDHDQSNQLPLIHQRHPLDASNSMSLPKTKSYEPKFTGFGLLLGINKGTNVTKLIFQISDQYEPKKGKVTRSPLLEVFISNYTMEKYKEADFMLIVGGFYQFIGTIQPTSQKAWVNGEEISRLLNSLFISDVYRTPNFLEKAFSNQLEKTSNQPSEEKPTHE